MLGAAEIVRIFDRCEFGLGFRWKMIKYEIWDMYERKETKDVVRLF